MKLDSKIYVAGHRGLVGSAIVRNLTSRGFFNIVTRTHSELDLTDQRAVAEFFDVERPEYVFLAAARVGGIMANNTYRADFIYENIMIEANVIHQAWRSGVRKLMFLGSTCIYPRDAEQPMREGELLTAPLEYTNEPYAIAKIAGIKLCESYNIQYGTDFISVMPTNLYGPYDNFDLSTSHVLPALMRKLHLGALLARGDFAGVLADLGRMPVDGCCGENLDSALVALARHGVRVDSSGGAVVEVWGSGRPLREFMWSEDMADACVYLMENVGWGDLTAGASELRNLHINIGTGREVSIAGLVELISGAVGYDGRVVFNSEKPDGTLRKLTDVGKLYSLGWRYRVEIEQGVRMLYDWYRGK